MSKARITVSLERCERAALMKLADIELRNPADQLRHILRQELERRGLLPPTGDQQAQGQTDEREAEGDFAS